GRDVIHAHGQRPGLGRADLIPVLVVGAVRVQVDGQARVVDRAGAERPQVSRLVGGVVALEAVVRQAVGRAVDVAAAPAAAARPGAAAGGDGAGGEAEGEAPGRHQLVD